MRPRSQSPCDGSYLTLHRVNAVRLINRRHSPPPKTNFEALQDILMKRKGMTLDVSSSGALANSLDTCVVRLARPLCFCRDDAITGTPKPRADNQDPSEPEFNTLVRIMATRCMLAAEYFCSGSVSKEAFGHYGLASPIYTHFTVSPLSFVTMNIFALTALLAQSRR